MQSIQKNRAHPWHGVSLGSNWPDIVNAYVEVVPSDTVKYELDKETGILKIDRPQQFSNIFPVLYGFIPQTYCGEKVGKFSIGIEEQVCRNGDGDPLDICILTEKIVSHGDILLQARPIGGFRLIDRDEVDDKIIAVLVGDVLYSSYSNIEELPKAVLKRLEHFFTTYKQMPGENEKVCILENIYGKNAAQTVIQLAHEDYSQTFDG